MHHRARGLLWWSLGCFCAGLLGCGSSPARNDPDAAMRGDAGATEASRPPEDGGAADVGAALDGGDAAAASLPTPPGVGLMHTLAQLDFMRAHRQSEPWLSARAQLLADAEAALGRTPEPAPDFDVPAYYTDPDGHEAAKRALAEDGFAAYALALGYQLADTDERCAAYADKTLEFLDGWAAVNTSVSGADGDLVMVYKGVQLLYAADLVARYPGWPEASRQRFRGWASGVFGSSADREKTAVNNHGAWGTLGAIAAAALLEDHAGVAAEVERLETRIRDAIADNGELPEENKRTNSGIWYTYFALASMTATAQIALNTEGIDLYGYASPNGRSLRLALDRLFFYSLHPDQWPYPLPDGPLGDIWRALYPCADELEVPLPNSWPANLFEVMSSVYGVDEWAAWVAPYRPQKGGQAWIYATLMRQTP